MPLPAHRLLPRVPVWLWRAFMAAIDPWERRRVALAPVRDVVSELDIPYGEGPDRRVDVIRPAGVERLLPVYVYVHGGGWTSGSKRAVADYCAVQAEAGMVVVNVEYRKAPGASMAEMLEDANAALAWVRSRIGGFGGDADRLVLGGDSAGGQLACLIAQLAGRAELARFWGIQPAVPAASIRGLVQHCAVLDFSVVFRRGFIMGLGFVRMLLPGAAGGEGLVRGSRWLSPIQWLWPGHPPIFVTTSRQDMFFEASRNFAEAARAAGIGVVEHIDARARHTWQQDAGHPASAAVYEKLAEFVRTVAAPAPVD